MKQTFLLVFILIMAGCSKVENSNVEGPPASPGANPPGNFSVVIDKVTDTEVQISWSNAVDPDQDAVHYDVVINDSVVGYDLVVKKMIVSGLLPDREYTAGVIALDPYRNSSKSARYFHTLKPFFKEITSVNPGFDFYGCQTGIKTNDKGYLISGYGENIYKGRIPQYFILKMDVAFNVEWMQLYNLAGYAQSLQECTGGGYIVTWGSTVTKINTTGDMLWSTTYPADDEIFLNSSTEDQDGNIFVTGFSSRHAQQDSVKYEYFVAKLSSGGGELWKKFGGTFQLNEPHKLNIQPDGRLVLFGRASDAPGSLRAIFWLLNLDNSGNFLNQHFYQCNVGGEDMPYSFVTLPANEQLLFGTVSGGSSIPRFTKIRDNWSVAWDHNYSLGSGGYNPSVIDFDAMGNGSYLVMCNDDEGENISVLNGNGDIERQILFNNFPIGLLVKYDSDGNYVYLAKTGDVFVINHDGYMGAPILNNKTTRSSPAGRPSR